MLDERRADLCNYRMKNSEDSLTVAEDCLEKGLRTPKEFPSGFCSVSCRRRSNDYPDNSSVWSNGRSCSIDRWS